MHVENFDRTINVAVIYPCKTCTAKLREETGKKRVMAATRIVYEHNVKGARYGFPGKARGMRTWSLDGDVLTRYSMSLPASPPSRYCESCGELNQGNAVTGQHNGEIKCGARCRNATGGDCECSCGGANHGTAH